MKNLIEDTSPRSVAIVAGLSIVLMAIAAGFSAGYVADALIVPGNAAATASNIGASETLFRYGILGWLVILILDVVVAWALYVFLKPVNASLSLLTAWLRLAYASLLGIGILNFMIVLLLQGGNVASVFEPQQLDSLVLLFVNAFDAMWSTIGLVVFGCHLLLLGWLVFRSGYVPKVIGFLLIVASCGYLAVNLGNLLLPEQQAFMATVERIFMTPMVVGEGRVWRMAHHSRWKKPRRVG